jgi:hypothetical protein
MYLLIPLLWSIAVKLRQNVIDYQVIELEPVFPLGIPDVFLHF